MLLELLYLQLKVICIWVVFSLCERRNSPEFRAADMDNPFIYYITFPYHFGKEISVLGLYYVLATEVAEICFLANYFFFTKSEKFFDTWLIMFFMALPVGLFEEVTDRIFSNRKKIVLQYLTFALLIASYGIIFFVLFYFAFKIQMPIVAVCAVAYIILMIAGITGTIMKYRRK